MGVARIVVPDASALVAALTDDDPVGSWAASAMRGARLAAPHLMPYEAGNVLRRLEAGGHLGAAVAARAHDQLLALPFDAYPYHVGVARARQLRANVTTYDAAYIAVAELVGGAVVTLDERLALAPGPRCRIVTPGTA